MIRSKLEATLTAGRPEEDGFRVIAAGAPEAERLVAAVRRFHGESGHEVGSEQATAVHDLCSDASLGRAWLLTDGRRDVGYALAYWRHSIDHGGRVAVLDDLWIEPGRRGRGLGARLLGAALPQIEEAGARAVILEADPADAMALYRRLGFAPKGTALLVSALPMARPSLVGRRSPTRPAPRFHARTRPLDRAMPHPVHRPGPDRAPRHRTAGGAAERIGPAPWRLAPDSTGRLRRFRWSPGAVSSGRG